MNTKVNHPPMTVKQLREYIEVKPNVYEAAIKLADFKKWYASNHEALPLGISMAFKTHINKLSDYCYTPTVKK